MDHKLNGIASPSSASVELMVFTFCFVDMDSAAPPPNVMIQSAQRMIHPYTSTYYRFSPNLVPVTCIQYL